MTREPHPTRPRRASRAVSPPVTLAATIALWAGALILFCCHLADALPIGTLGTDLWCGWLFTLGAAAFQTTFLRVTPGLLAADWQAGVALGDLNHLPLGSSTSDDILTAPPPNGLVHPALWPLFAASGCALWALAIGYTALAGAGYLDPRPSDALLALVCLAIPAAQCTAAAVNGPPLTRQHIMRRAAALAHHQLRRHGAEAAAAAALAELASRDPRRAAALLADLAAQARDTYGADATPDLHVVNGARDRERRT